MKKSLIALLAAVALMAAAQSPGSDAPAAPGQTLAQANIQLTEEDVVRCIRSSDPCTVWSKEELVELIKRSYTKGWQEGRDKLAKELKRGHDI